MSIKHPNLHIFLQKGLLALFNKLTNAREIIELENQLIDLIEAVAAKRLEHLTNESTKKYLI